MDLRKPFRSIARRSAALLRDRGVRVPVALLTQKEPFVRGVSEMLGPEDVVLDIGAHTGLCSVEFAHRARKVYAFEPHPEIFRELQHNTRNYRNIEVFEAAISDETGTAQLFFEPPGRRHAFQGSTLKRGKTNITYENAHEVKTISLADFVMGLDAPVRLAKMDIEGAEFDVIAALLETQAVHRIEKLWVETHEDRIPSLVPQRAAVEARIAELGVGHRFDFDWP